jgi:hypothetical protein
MRVFRTILISLIFSMFLSPSFAGTKIDSYKQQLLSNLTSKPTDQLIWIRSINNTYGMFCKNLNSKEHRFYSKVVSPIVSKYIAITGMERSDWGYTGDVKYKYRKGLLIGRHKKDGTKIFCDCVFNSIVKGITCFQ